MAVPGTQPFLATRLGRIGRKYVGQVISVPEAAGEDGECIMGTANLPKQPFWCQIRNGAV